MAGVSTKEVRRRMRSMESTRQITRAMEMVAASRLRKAQSRITQSRPYFQLLYQTISRMAGVPSPYFSPKAEGKLCCIVIAGDRGMAGGYNSNVLRLARETLAGRPNYILPIGKKAVEHFRTEALLTERYTEAADISVGDCFTMAKQLANRYAAGEFAEINLVYTNFASLLAQTPAVLPLLPLCMTRHAEREADVLYEPDPQAVLDAIIPEYLGGVIYGALCESVASELAARRAAMESATKNADEMLENLHLQYNRARQGAITQEITEIVAGAEA